MKACALKTRSVSCWRDSFNVAAIPSAEVANERCDRAAFWCADAFAARIELRTPRRTSNMAITIHAP
jgi:hypothetical protein